MNLLLCTRGGSFELLALWLPGVPQPVQPAGSVVGDDQATVVRDQHADRASPGLAVHEPAAHKVFLTHGPPILEVDPHDTIALWLRKLGRAMHADDRVALEAG